MSDSFDSATCTPEFSPDELGSVLAEMTPAERAEYDSLTRPPVWSPLPGPQTLAFFSPADELFYGGAAGGGKSDLLLGLALTAQRKSLYLRREAAQLQAITQRLTEIVGRAGRWRSSGHGGLMRTRDGRSLELGGCEHEDDRRNYQGRPHDAKLWDEVSQFSETQYVFVNGWNRTTTLGQRCRVVAAGNPPLSAEGEWVIRRWAPWLDRQHPRPARPAELRWYASVEGKDREVESERPFTWKGEEVLPRSRTFIPAKLADNPFLVATGYAATLDAMPEPLRSQLKYGDFTVGREDDACQVIPTAWVLAAQARWSAARPADARLTCVGVDVARGGKDKTVIARRYGAWFAPLLKHPGAETADGPTVAGKVLLALEGELSADINVDVIGVGASAYDSLNAVRASRLKVQGVNASAKAPGRDRAGVLSFVNTRAFAYWALRDALDPVKGDGLALPPDPELLADLTAPRWVMRASGVQVESKDNIIERIGRSPDCGDAAVLANLPGRPEWVVRFY